MKYTVKQFIPTGKTDPKYGPEYMVVFNEDERPAKINFKEAPTEGQEIEGTIEDGKYGTYFKRGSSFGGGKKQWQDNSDGMRQGMCFNNAAAYVNTLEFVDKEGKPKALTNIEWAETVFSYAQALYAKGDLKQTLEGSQVSEQDDVNQEQAENVQAVFGPAANPKPRKEA